MDLSTEPPAASRDRYAERRESAARVAIEHLRAGDRRMADLIARIGPHRPIITRDPFATLVGSIVSQQISMAAAAAIQKRLAALCPRGRVTHRAILGLHARTLRSAGLSRQKILYLRSLAEHFADGRLSPRALRAMPDDEVIAATTRVKGIGRWTAEMLLIFCLERPDVWPIDDLGIRKAVRGLLGCSELPDRDTMSAVADPWRPFRSYASWYLWRSLEGPLMPGVRF